MFLISKAEHIGPAITYTTPINYPRYLLGSMCGHLLYSC